MDNQEQKPKIGVGVMVLKEGKVLLGMRKGSHGDGSYSFPGGHVEYMESFENCARRETREEAGIEIKNIRFLNVANVIEYAPRHYINIEIICDWAKGEPQTFPNEKIGDWQWHDISDLPKPLFLFSEQAIETYKTGKNFFDSRS
jgi:8-oxo-dGTP diphosphatase